MMAYCWVVEYLIMMAYCWAIEYLIMMAEYSMMGVTEYRIAQNGGGGKLWQIDGVKSFGEENVGEFNLLTNS